MHRFGGLLHFVHVHSAVVMRHELIGLKIVRDDGRELMVPMTLEEIDPLCNPLDIAEYIIYGK